MSESKTPRTDALAAKHRKETEGNDVRRSVEQVTELLAHANKLETELSAALQRTEKAEKDLMRLSCTFAIERDARHQAEAELSRYREAEKALPEEPTIEAAYLCEADLMRCGHQCGYCARKELATYTNALRAHAAALQAEREKIREDAERYQWARENHVIDYDALSLIQHDVLTLSEWTDAAIDAERGKK